MHINSSVNQLLMDRMISLHHLDNVPSNTSIELGKNLTKRLFPSTNTANKKAHAETITINHNELSLDELRSRSEASSIQDLLKVIDLRSYKNCPCQKSNGELAENFNAIIRCHQFNQTNFN